MITLIIILVLILAILIAGFIAYFTIRKKVRDFSEMAFGTTDIKKGFEDLKLQEEITPKSVSGMTSLLLPKICADFEHFNFNEMKEKAENVLLSYLRSITERRSSLCIGGSTELIEQSELYIQMLSKRGLTEHFDRVHIHQTEIHRYRNTQGRCIVTFQTAFECYHYLTDETGKVVEGYKDHKHQTKYNVDMIFVQDSTVTDSEHDMALGLVCPNCGAPLTSIGEKQVCEYCGTSVSIIDRNLWTFNHVEKVG